MVLWLCVGRRPPINDPYLCTENDTVHRVVINTYNRPGSNCNSKSDCCTNCECVNKLCKGRRVGELCTNSLDCDIGLYCYANKSICAKAQRSGQYCDPEMLCNSYFLCVNNRCVEYGSMNSGSVINRTNSQENFLEFACRTGYAINSGKDLICSEGYVLEADKVPCVNGAKNCTYYNSNGELFHARNNCTCGYSMHRIGYCAPGVGNQTYMNNFETIISYSKLHRPCHVLSEPNDKLDNPLFCDSSRYDKVGEDAYLAFLELNETIFIQIQDNKHEVRNNETNYYWKYNMALNWGSVGILSLLSIILIVI